MNGRKSICLFAVLFFALLSAGSCGKKSVEEEPVRVLEEKEGTALEEGGDGEALSGAESSSVDAAAGGASSDDSSGKAGTVRAPDKETVLAMREKVLAGMDEEAVSALKETIKVANLSMEALILNENLEKKLSDPENTYWELFEKTGDIRIGWALEEEQQKKRGEYKDLTEEEFGERFGTPVYRYNRFAGEDFIRVMEEWKEKVPDEALKADFDRLAACMASGMEEHDAADIMSVYEMLHDMDYFLFRYGPEDVGGYVKDRSTVGRFYGSLEVYGGRDS